MLHVLHTAFTVLQGFITGVLDQLTLQPTN